VVTCVLTSNGNCVTGSPATSNAITMTVNPPAPAAPVATAGSGTACTSFTANWNASTNATSYILTVSKNPSFNNLVIDNLNVRNVTSYEVTGLVAGTIYYYHVQATNSCGSSVSSSDINYTTPTIPATPGTITGTPSTCSGTTGLIYSISAVTGATTY